MKILCVSDYVDPLIYNQNVKEAFPDIDLVLCAGDLPMDYIDFIVTVFNKPTYFIFGNHNLKEYPYFHSDSHISASRLAEHYADSSHGHGATYLGFKHFEDERLSFTDPKTGKKTPLLIAGCSGSAETGGQEFSTVTSRPLKSLAIFTISFSSSSGTRPAIA